MIRTVCNVNGDCAGHRLGLRAAEHHGVRKRPPRAPDEPFHAGGVLETLCGSFITVPLHERESLDLFKPPPDSLTNIEELFGHVFLMMSGMPEAVEWFIDEEALLAEFVRAGRNVSGILPER